MLKVSDLNVSYGQSQVIHGIYFTASKNETVAIMGRNGMGKTTLFKALMGVLPARSGKIDARWRRGQRKENLSARGQWHRPMCRRAA